MNKWTQGLKESICSLTNTFLMNLPLPLLLSRQQLDETELITLLTNKYMSQGYYNQ